MRVRHAVTLALMLATLSSAGAADLGARAGRFVATCEDLGQFCFADGCGRDQIEAALNCQARCRSSNILSVVPATCSVEILHPQVSLRRRG